MKTASAFLSHRFFTAALLCMMLIVSVSAQAQRPSIADLIAQINAQGNDTTTPEGQVRTALALIPAFQAAVVQYFHANGEAPADRVQAGLTGNATDTSTNYIHAVAIVNGTIVVTFGNSADASIAAKIMTFTPYESNDLTVSWRCGGDDSFPSWFNLLGTTSGGQSAQYIAPTIPESTYPDPCILLPQPSAGDADVIRAQVRSALDLIPEFQEAVVRAFRFDGEAPYDRSNIELTSQATDTSTKFIHSIEVVNGTIVVTFGNEAHPAIHWQYLTFTPYESPDLTVDWRCGSDPAPANMSLLGSSGGGNTANYMPPSIPQRYEPKPCILRSLPGSQKEIIQAQVLEPFDVIEKFKDAVEIAGESLGEFGMPTPPEDRAEAGLTMYPDDTVGNYFESIDIDYGTITVTYGNESNAAIYGETLSFTPYESNDGTIVWRCGLAVTPQNTNLMGAAAGGSMASYRSPSSGMLALYLPPSCRP